MILVLIIILFTSEVSPLGNYENNIHGHLQKLGSHTDPHGITMIGRFSDPEVFYAHFVRLGQPILMRGALKEVKHPGLTAWTDEYLRSHYGNSSVKIESSRKEKRGSKPAWLPFHQFLSRYLKEDIYMVNSLDNEMKDLALVPLTLHCGGFEKLLQEAVVWMGSGESKSVLHYDKLDNLLCLLDGRKHFVLIDKVHKELVESDGFNQAGGYSEMDVDKVDMIKFPNFQNITWHEAILNKGDCLFIPRGWYHQVSSSGWRHLAINLWFSHLFWFDVNRCPENRNLLTPLQPLSTFDIASPNEFYRTQLLDILHDKGPMARSLFISVLKTSTKERREQFFTAVNKYKDGALAWNELHGFNIDKAILKFPDIFGLPSNDVLDEDEEVILYTEDEPFEEDSEYSDPDDQGENSKELDSEKYFTVKNEPIMDKEQYSKNNSYNNIEPGKNTQNLKKDEL